jgi:uncharacterized protein YunC (DUF1805 family)
MKTGLIRKTEEDKVVELMCVLLELKEESETVVKVAVKEKGVKVFFDSIDQLNIEDLEKERVKALKQVIDAKEREIENMEGADVNGN